MTKHFYTSLTIGATLALALPQATLADVTSQQVWDSWKAALEKSGMEISIGNTDAQDGVITLSDVTLKADTSEGTSSGSFDKLVFRDQGDGTVLIIQPEVIPYSMHMTPQDAGTLEMAMILRQEGSHIVASGNPGDITFDYQMDLFSLTIDKMIIDDEDIEADVKVSLSNIDGSYSLTEGDKSIYTSKMAASNLGFDASFNSPGTEDRMSITGNMADLDSQSVSEIIGKINMSDPSLISSGKLNTKGEFSVGNTTMAMKLTNEDGDFNLDTTADEIGFDFSLQNGNLSYGETSKNVSYALVAAGLPFPEVTAKIAETAFHLQMPMAKSESQEDMAILMKMIGLEISDEIWSMFDPQGALPHDPADLDIDLTGKMNWLVNITDPKQTAEFEGDSPVLFHELNINKIALAAIGADISGTGGFTFDNSDTETFDGIPAPTGSLEISINGANGLMDRLVQMGYLPEDQAMGARMMLGMFARPAEGEDALKSTLEIKDGGSIFANGMQIR